MPFIWGLAWTCPLNGQSTEWISFVFVGWKVAAAGLLILIKQTLIKSTVIKLTLVKPVEPAALSGTPTITVGDGGRIVNPYCHLKRYQGCWPSLFGAAAGSLILIIT